MPNHASHASARRLVTLVCAAQVLVQIGAYFWPALLPTMIPLWGLTNSEAGWITGIFYAAYMLAVPVLVTLTDRVDARLVYLFGVGCTVGGHLLFGLAAEGFWSALALRGARRRRLGGNLYDRPQAPGRPGRCKDDVARDDGPRRQHRRFRCPLVLLCRRARGLVRLAGRFHRRGIERRSRVADRGHMGAAAPSPRTRRRRREAVRFPAGLPQPIRHGVLDRLLRTHARNERAARLGRGIPRFRGGERGCRATACSRPPPCSPRWA